MNLERLELYGFRSYEAGKADFVPGVNLICGDNAQGKTNLLEAISYLSSGKSFRTARQQELIRFGSDFADLQAKLFSQGREQTIRAVLFADRRPRQIFLGGVKQKSAALLPGVLTTVLFCPDDLLVLKNGAAGRRKLLDGPLGQLRPFYAQALAEYGRLYESKAKILRDHRDFPSLLAPLPEYNEQMASLGAAIVGFRARYLLALEKAAAAYHRDFSGGKETLTLTYQTVSTVTDPFAPREAIAEQLREHQRTHYEAELESGLCLTGPHKDDFDARLDGVSVKSFGSQGQTRTAAISLKLAERELLRREFGEEPVLLLDDVLSELDPRRQDFVLNQIGQGQVFITCCEKGRLTKLGKTFVVENGTCRVSEE
jgi:DNA replication and repair protein RecF